MKGIDKLKELMIGKVSMFSGHSGSWEINIGKCHGAFAFKTNVLPMHGAVGVLCVSCAASYKAYHFVCLYLAAVHTLIPMIYDISELYRRVELLSLFYLKLIQKGKMKLSISSFPKTVIRIEGNSLSVASRFGRLKTG
jgi:hypothetical protein